MKRNIITIIITAIIIATMWVSSPKAADSKIIEVLTVNPKIKNINDYINATGKIKEGTRRNIYVDGIAEITKTYVEVGDKVEKDTVLAEIAPVSALETNPFDYFPDTSGIEDVFHEYGVDMDLDFDTYKTSKITLPVKAKSIKSPISGIVTSVNVKEGDVVTAINRIISVSDFSDLYIEAMVPEEYSSKLSEGKSVEISAESFGDNKYYGKIKYIYPVAKYVPSLTGNGKTYIECVISINGINDSLRPGLSVNTKITANTITDALTLPYECIMQDEENREYVYCIENGTAKKCYIDVGYELEDMVEIKKGVSVKDKIIINPPDSITENIQVKEVVK